MPNNNEWNVERMVDEQVIKVLSSTKFMELIGVFVKLMEGWMRCR